MVANSIMASCYRNCENSLMLSSCETASDNCVTDQHIADDTIYLVNKVAYCQLLNLVSSCVDKDHQNITNKKSTPKITPIGNEALSLRPKRRFCVNGGDAGNDQYHVMGLLRRLLTLPVSSPLGRRMIQYIETNLFVGGSSLNPCTVAHTLFGSSGTPEYGAFCRTPVKSAFNGRLQWRQFAARFRHNECVYCHRYCFSRADRQQFCKRYDTGLSSRSRNLQKRYSKCFVSLYRLEPKEVADWRTSKRLRDIVEKPRPELFINLIDTDESISECEGVAEVSVVHAAIRNSSAGTTLRMKSPASKILNVNLPASKSVPLILKRQIKRKVLMPDESPTVITLSSDSEDETAVAAKSFIFHCHKCGAEIACGKQYPDLVKTHYRTMHNICNMDFLYQKQPNGETTLSVVQIPQASVAVTTSTCMPSLPLPASNYSITTASFADHRLPLPTASRLAAPGNLTPVNARTPFPVLMMSCPSTAAAFASVKPSISNVISVVPQPRAVFMNNQSVLGANGLFSTRVPVTLALRDVSRKLISDSGNITAASASLNNCSRSLINGVGSSSSALCESDVICLD